MGEAKAHIKAINAALLHLVKDKGWTARIDGPRSYFLENGNVKISVWLSSLNIWTAASSVSIWIDGRKCKHRSTIHNGKLRSAILKLAIRKAREIEAEDLAGVAEAARRAWRT